MSKTCHRAVETIGGTGMTVVEIDIEGYCELFRRGGSMGEV
jgi:hypothetical protein